MWYLLLLAGLAAASAPAPEPSFKERRLQYIVTNQNLHVDKLFDDIKSLEKKFSKLGGEVDLKKVRHIKARVSNLEGDGCEGEHEAQCGGDVPECISDLFFCDGHKDCKNGGDEDPDTCSEAIAHVGSSYTGLASWSSCEQHQPHHAVVVITSSHREDDFQPRILVKGVLTLEVDEESHIVKTTQLSGYYNFGQRELVLDPFGEKTTGNYGVRCEFNLGDDDHADCEIVIPSSLHVCAHFNAERH